MRNTKMGSRGLASLTALIAMLTLAACGGGSDAADGSTKMTIVSLPGEVYVLEEVALDQGFYEDNGLDVELIAPQNGASGARQLLLGGSVQGWPGNPATVMQDSAKNFDVALVAMIKDWIPFQLQVRADSDLADVEGDYLDKIRALKGKVIGLTGLGSLPQQIVETALGEAGLTPSDVTFVGVGLDQAGIASLQNDRIDAYFTFSYLSADAVQSQADAVKYLGLADADAPPTMQTFSTWTLAASGDFAEKEPQAVEGWAAAIREAYEWTKTNPEKAAQIVADKNFKGENVEELTEWIQMLTSGEQSPDLTVDPETLQSEIDALRGAGALPPEDTGLLYEDLVPEFARQ
ncbi:MAG: ABC transporter substrate-binding protein [Aeromicrobium sp.]|uniref:ABC transporter substrate-binding protein n=1 Tax=Aeromicrobium sp. TaxID=1871063 RepID=UPI002637B1FE|nr:ABC transporter substrate-binding protein [Aeromicrobium sp.]MDF1706159.1 ABC transporter substrate-binding protein [Aeromicrobium sp.]